MLLGAVYAVSGAEMQGKTAFFLERRRKNMQRDPMPQNDPSGLESLWQQIDTLMRDRRMRDSLLHVAYTDSLHEYFTAIALGQLEADGKHIEWIAKPLKRFFNARLKVSERALAELETKQEALSVKVTPLFKDKANPQLQAQYVQHDYDARLHRESAQQAQEALQTLAWITADPRFKQVDPALQGHALDF